MIPYSLGQQIQFIGSSGDTLNLNVSVESKFTEEPDCLTCSETGPINAQSIFFTLTHLQDTVIELYSQARFGNYLNFNVGYPRYSNGKWNIMSPSIYVPNNSTELECISSANRNCLDTITKRKWSIAI